MPTPYAECPRCLAHPIWKRIFNNCKLCNGTGFINDREELLDLIEVYKHALARATYLITSGTEEEKKAAGYRSFRTWREYVAERRQITKELKEPVLVCGVSNE